ncbi:MAG TPA: transporter [Flavobacteriales bacterium]|nr:transporter [Flavobacteriales bacterium]
MDFIAFLEQENVRKIIYVLLVILLASFLVLFIKKAFNKIIQSNEQKYKARKATNILGYIFVAIAVIYIYSEQLGAIGIALGVAGAGITFALQEVIVSFAGWLFIVFTNKIEIGQRLKIVDIKGDVIDIGVLSTSIMEIGDWVKGDLYNGRITLIPNSFVFKEKIQNYSAEYPFLWDEITVPVSHNSDYNLARKIFNEILLEVCSDYAVKSQKKWNELNNKYKVENAEVNPMVHMSFDENWIIFTLRYVVDYKKRRSTKDLISTRILEELKKHENAVEVASSALRVFLMNKGQD